MKKILWSRFSGVMVVLVMFCAFGFASTALAQQPKYGGILKIITNRSAPSNYGIPVEAGAGGLDQTSGIIERLFTTDGSHRPIPYLCTSYELAPDKSFYTLHLKKGVKFHDGTDFNAEAVKWNLNMSVELKKPSMRTVKEIEVVDDYTIKLHISKFDNSLLPNFYTSQGTMISPTAVKKHGKRWVGSHPVGTGPFEFVSFEKDTSVKYKKFDGYWDKGKPYIDGVEWHVIKDPTVALVSFQKGEAQVLFNPKERYANELKEKGYSLLTAPFLTVSIVGDTIHPDSPLANKKVLEAIEYAIDKKTIADTLGQGFWEATVTSQAERREGFGYNSDYKGRPYNVEKAKRLMTEAGYPNGFKTTLIMRQGFKDLAIALQGYLGEIGIQFNIEMVDRPKWVDYRYKKGWNNTIFHMLWGPGDKTQQLYRFLGGTSYTSLLKPPAYKKAIAGAVATSDYAEKEALTREAIKILADTSTVIPLYLNTFIAATDKSVHNFGFGPGYPHAFSIKDVWLSE
jgi:peptide/nickel transport system substrate-binding protein